MMDTGVIPNTGEPYLVLSKRESRLVRLLVDALGSKEIAALLFVSTNTVNGHIADLGRALAAAQLPPRSPFSRAEIVKFALQNDALHPGLILIHEHPSNCRCAATYCQTTYRDPQ